MSDEVVLKMKKLKELWGNLKDENNPKIKRREAAKEIVKLQEELKDVDGFEPIDLSRTQYSEFTPIDYRTISNVNWGEELALSYLDNAVELVKDCENRAVQMTRERLPKEPVDSQKFGMIVSAYTDKVLRAYIFQNS